MLNQFNLKIDYAVRSQIYTVLYIIKLSLKFIAYLLSLGVNNNCDALVISDLLKLLFY